MKKSGKKNRKAKKYGIMTDFEVVDLVKILEKAAQNIGTFYGPNERCIMRAAARFLVASVKEESPRKAHRLAGMLKFPVWVSQECNYPIVLSGMTGKPLYKSPAANWRKVAL